MTSETKDDEKISPALYTLTQSQLLLMAGTVLRMPLGRMLEAIARSHAAAPVIDPTLYRKAMGNLAWIEKIARAAQAFQKEVRQAYRDAGVSDEVIDAASGTGFPGDDKAGDGG